MLDRLLSTIAPHICCSCGVENALLCEYCFFDICEDAYAQCIVCMRPTNDDNLCSGCRHGAGYDGAWVVGERIGGLCELIDQYKFDRAHEAADIIAQLINRRLPVLPADTVVCYIPDIAVHRRQRGYDHMRRVAEAVAAYRSLPCRPLLVRQTSLSQRGADKQTRAKRQIGAFRVDDDIDYPVLLVDDIYTTGATIGAGVSALSAKSSSPIFVAVVARQPFAK